MVMMAEAGASKHTNSSTHYSRHTPHRNLHQELQPRRSAQGASWQWHQPLPSFGLPSQLSVLTSFQCETR